MSGNLIDRKENKTAQVAMHKNFFDSVDSAIEGGFYLEAVFREYAAIESRLEALLGVLGAPCGRMVLQDGDRRKVQISHRVECLKKIYCASENIGKTKLDNSFFNSLEAWIKNRNIYVHGLYKGEEKYNERSKASEKLAKEGKDLAKYLYNEVKRVRRYISSHPDVVLCTKHCYNSSCNYRDLSMEVKNNENI